MCMSDGKSLKVTFNKQKNSKILNSEKIKILKDGRILIDRESEILKVEIGC